MPKSKEHSHGLYTYTGSSRVIPSFRICLAPVMKLTNRIAHESSFEVISTSTFFSTCFRDDKVSETRTRRKTPKEIGTQCALGDEPIEDVDTRCIRSINHACSRCSTYHRRRSDATCISTRVCQYTVHVGRICNVDFRKTSCPCSY